MGCGCSYTLIKGDSFQVGARLEQGALTMLPVVSLSQTAPLVVNSPGHGLPASWRVAFSGMAGMEYLNAKSDTPTAEDFYETTVIDADHFSIAEPFRQGFSFNGFGGFLFRRPVNLAGYTASLSIWDSATPDTPVYTTDSTSGGVIISVPAASVLGVVPPSVTASLTVVGSPSFTLDITTADGIKVTILRDALTISSEGAL